MNSKVKYRYKYVILRGTQHSGLRPGLISALMSLMEVWALLSVYKEKEHDCAELYMWAAWMLHCAN